MSTRAAYAGVPQTCLDEYADAILNHYSPLFFKESANNLVGSAFSGYRLPWIAHGLGLLGWLGVIRSAIRPSTFNRQS